MKEKLPLIRAKRESRLPLISIIIINFNGKKYVLNCLKSIFKNHYPNYEVIVVDNGSNDGSVEAIKKNFGNRKNVQALSLKKNFGPAYARNRGVEKAKGKYLGFLDNDTLVHPDWMKNAIPEFEKNKKLGIVQCKLLLAKEKNKIDYVGEFLGQNGFLVQIAKGGDKDEGQYNKKLKILAAKSAGMFIRKKTFQKAGGFDQDYFIYVEETDLGWRSWLAGYEALFVPESIVYHEFGTSTVILGKSKADFNAKFHGTKNYILTLFKNLETINLCKILSVHIFLWVGMAWFILFSGRFKQFIWIHQGIFWNIINFKKNLKKRVKIQEQRVISDEALFKIFMKRKSFFYFLHKVINPNQVGNAEGFLKSK